MSDDLHDIILSALLRVAPDIEADDVTAGTDLRQDLELDSVDFLNFVVALHDRLGVDVPEGDYRRLRTLAEATSYLEERLAEGPPSPS